MASTTGLNAAFNQECTVEITLRIKKTMALETNPGVPHFLRIGDAERRVSEAAVRDMHKVLDGIGIYDVGITSSCRSRNYWSFDDGRTVPNRPGVFQEYDHILLLWNPEISDSQGFTGVVVALLPGDRYSIVLDHNENRNVYQDKEIIEVSAHEIARSPIPADAKRKRI